MHHVRRIAVCYNLFLTYFSYDDESIQIYCASSVKMMPTSNKPTFCYIT